MSKPRILAFAGSARIDSYNAKVLRIAAAGDTATARRWLVEGTTQGAGRSSREMFQLYDLEMMARNPRAAVAAAASFQEEAHSNQLRYLPASLAAGLAHRLAGDSAASRAAFGEARVELQDLVDEDPTESRYRSALGLALAGLGRNEEAIREGEAGLRLMPPEKEAWRGAWRLLDLARIEAMTGRHDAAIERLEYMLSVPSDISVWMLRLDPAWDPLRGNPRFEALVGEG